MWGGHLLEAVLDGRGDRVVLCPHTSQLNPLCFTPLVGYWLFAFECAAGPA